MANELIYSGGDATKRPIAVASIAGLEKLDAGTGDFRIVFNLSGGGKAFWTYATALLRNTAYAHIITQYAWSAD